MHAAAVVLLIYQRTRNVWRRLWEVESGQMSAPGQVGVAASQLLLTLTILSPLPLCFSNVDQRSMNSFTCILCYLQLCTDKSNASLGAARLRSWILAWACLDQRGWRWGRCDIQLDKGQKHDLRNMQSVPKLEGEVSLELWKIPSYPPVVNTSAAWTWPGLTSDFLPTCEAFRLVTPNVQHAAVVFLFFSTRVLDCLFPPRNPFFFFFFFCFCDINSRCVIVMTHGFFRADFLGSLIWP